MGKQDIWDTNLFELAEQALEQYPSRIPFDDFSTYHLLEPIGAGGMGEVFLAEDSALKRHVAIKFLRTSWFETDRKDRFTREVRTLAQLEHPYVARLYEAGIDAHGTPYLVMEYVKGKPLNVYCRENGYSLEKRLILFRSVCEAVEYAHSRAAIHLDLKPSNILVTKDGTPKLLDFGIAKPLQELDQLASETQSAFTPEFAAPEQIRNEAVGTYTDVYALGVILYELLCDQPPFRLEGSLELREYIGRPSSQPGRLPASKFAWRDLDALCRRAMQDNGQERYLFVAELIQDIDHFCCNMPLKAGPDRFPYRATKFVRRHGKAIFSSVAVTLLAAALTGFYTIRLKQARDAALVQANRAEHTKGLLLRVIGGGYGTAASADEHVVDVLGSAVKQAHLLNNEPAVQSDLYETVGVLYHNLGDFDRADSLLQSALAERRALYGSDSPEAGEVITALAMLRIDQARFPEAEKLARNEIDIARQKLPSTYLLLGQAMTALGSALQHDGRLRESIDILQRAVQIEEGRRSDEAEFVVTLGYLANAYLLSGQEATAEPLERRVLEEDRRLDGDRSPGVAEDLSNLSLLEIKRGLYVQAERDAREALDIDRGWYRQENAEVALLEEALSDALIHCHKYDEASSFVASGMHALEVRVGKNHPFVGYGLNLAGVLALRRGDLKAASLNFDRMQDIYRANFRDNDRHLALGWLRMGELYLAEHRLNDGESAFRRSVDIFTAGLGANNPETGAARIELGDILFHEGKYAQAELEIDRGYKSLTKEGEPMTEAAIEARERLSELHNILHRPGNFETMP